jgi:hypothetical protein
MSERDFYGEHYGQLVGKEVSGVVEDASGEFPCYGLQFTDGSIAWILADPEGNGPGFLEIPPPKRNAR